MKSSSVNAIGGDRPGQVLQFYLSTLRNLRSYDRSYDGIGSVCLCRHWGEFVIVLMPESVQSTMLHPKPYPLVQPTECSCGSGPLLGRYRSRSAGIMGGRIPLPLSAFSTCAFR